MIWLGGYIIKTIWKYTLKLCDTQIISVPKMRDALQNIDYLWAQPLHIGQQNNLPTLWFKVDTDLPKVDIEIRIAGTGHEIPPEEQFEYIGTSICDLFVWHIFARVL